MDKMPDLGQFVDYVWSLKAERDQLRAELEAADVQKERWVAWAKELGEKCDRLEAEAKAIRGQQVVGYQYQDRNGEWRGFCDEEHYQNTVEDGTWPIRAIYAVVSTKNAEEGE